MNFRFKLINENVSARARGWMAYMEAVTAPFAQPGSTNCFISVEDMEGDTEYVIVHVKVTTYKRDHSIQFRNDFSFLENKDAPEDATITSQDSEDPPNSPRALEAWWDRKNEVITPDAILTTLNLLKHFARVRDGEEVEVEVAVEVEEQHR